MPSAENSATIAAHADWSVDPRKRWVAVARLDEGLWRLAAPVLVGEVSTFFARLRQAAHGGAGGLRLGLPNGLPRALAALPPEKGMGFLPFLKKTPHMPC